MASDAALLTAKFEDGRLELAAGGSWTAPHAAELETLVDRAAEDAAKAKAVSIDMRGVREFDTYGAWLLERLTRQWRGIGGQASVVGMPEHDRTLLKEMSGVNLEPVAPPARPNPIVSALAAMGRGMTGFGRDLGTFANMLGAIGVAATRVVARPRDFRFTSAVNQLDRVCWQAVPIILLITFLIGAIIAQQGIFHFRKFGAEMYAVDLVGILILREVGVLIVAIMVAGRSGSSYTAELGSMMMREEVDALRTMGFDPVEVLILPRVLVLIIALPILTFLGSMAALYGGGRRRLALWRHESRDLHFAARRGHLADPFQGRDDQGAVHGAGDRRGGLRRGPAGQGQRRVARPADHEVGGEVDLPRHRARWAVRHLLRFDRNVMNAKDKPVISIKDLVVGFGDQTVLDHLSLDVRKGEILGVVGKSGGGKSVLLRTIIGLLPKWHGKIEVLGVDLDTATEQERRALERRWGVLFQQGALFSSLTVRQNVQFPMRENLEISQRLMDEMALAKLDMVGLTPIDAEKFPSELSGGMTKRAALARALALDPEIVFLDEPTSGLDPIAAGDFDALIKTLQRTLGLTVYMNTHDLESLYTVCDRIAALADGRIVALGPMETMLECTHPWVQTYFQGKRGGMLTNRLEQVN